ncbi:guanylate kinase [bacterium]|nr:MAG: guanylate kinase [bacterium]
MIVLISGPSGAGKSSVIAGLMAADHRLAFSVSTTTRPPRGQEQDGVDYDFVDGGTFDRLLADGAFVEWAEVHGERYATRHERLAQLESAGSIPLLDIDVQGGVQVIPRYGDSLVSIFLFPPSWAELEQRLRGRGTDDDEVIARRLSGARSEVAEAGHYRYWVVNDDLERAVARLQAILMAEECRRENLGESPLAG